MEPLHLILCAGSGTRLFPLSNNKMPKQFLRIENDYSLVQNTILRMSQFPELVITTMHKYLDILESQLAELKLNCKYTIVVVPETYNTAYSICAVSLLFKDRKIIAIPSDKIFKQNEFNDLMESAKTVLNNRPENILFIGIKPTYPSTAFGYLKVCGDNVAKFVEKPSFEKAKEFIENNQYYWNGGMIGFSSPILINAYETYRPDILRICEDATNRSEENNNKKIRLITLGITNEYVEDISIDYAINEKLSMEKMSFLSFDGQWSDVGSWNSVYDVLEKNEDGINITANYKSYNSKNCLIITDKQVFLNGMSNIVLIETDDKILLSDMDKSQDIKKLLSK